MNTMIGKGALLMNTTSNLSHNLKEIRLQHGDTQESLAKKLNLSRGPISTWENGRSIPDPSTLERICQLYDITEEDLFRDTSSESVPVSTQSKINFTLIKECFILVFLSVFSCGYSYNGLVLALGVLIWTYKNRKQYKVVLIVVIVTSLICTYNCYVDLNSTYQFNSTTTIEYIGE